jgi:V8-like Glu-specific endopeptidase
MITITHLSGFGRGKSKTYPGPNVILGTDPSCDVRFDPTWDKEVSPRHAQISILNGECLIDDLGSTTGVWINGKKIVREPLRGTVEVNLGQNGQRLQIQVAALPMSSSPSPQPTAAAPGPTRSKAMPIALGIAAVLAVAFITIKQRVNIGGNEVTITMGEEKKAETKSAPSNEKPAPTAHEPTTPIPVATAPPSQDTDTRILNAAKSYEKAIGLVVLAKEGSGDGCGTAWAVAEDIFATNAHVAMPIIRTMRAGGSAFVVINKNPELRYRVRAAIPHPRYFESPVNIDGKSPAASPYDVALLIVEGKCPVSMKLAARQKLETLDSGHRVAFLGFPMENLINGGVDMHLPVATMQSGIVTANTDFWLAKAPFESRTLVQHNLPATGGASGSPIFDADGEVVAILSAGNITFTVSTSTWAQMMSDIESAKREVITKAKAQISAPGMTEKKKTALIDQVEATLGALNQVPLPVMTLGRSPSAAQVNFAQRIDMLDELISEVEKARAEGKF